MMTKLSNFPLTPCPLARANPEPIVNATNQRMVASTSLTHNEHDANGAFIQLTKGGRPYRTDKGLRVVYGSEHIGIEVKTKMRDKIIVDRTVELEKWAKSLRKVHKRKIQIFACANNHHAGHASDTVRLFKEMWSRKD
jgi:uncharacterized protein YecE (DUF72 family)